MKRTSHVCWSAAILAAVLAVTLLSTAVWAASQTRAPAAMYSSSGWLDPAAVLVDDGIPARYYPLGGPVTTDLVVGGFGFTIPGDATIDRIDVEVHVWAHAPGATLWVQIMPCPVCHDCVEHDVGELDVGWEYDEPPLSRSVGGTFAYWSCGMVPGNINDPAFSVRVWGETGSHWIFVDYIEVTVQYTEAGADTTPPVLSVPPDATVECDESTDPSNTGTATATDDTDPSPVVTYADGPMSYVPGSPTHWFFRTWTATDASGNAASGDQRIDIRVPTSSIVGQNEDWFSSLPDTFELYFTCDKCGVEGSLLIDGAGGAGDGPTAPVVCDGSTLNTLTVDLDSGLGDGLYDVRINLVVLPYGWMGSSYTADMFGIDTTPPSIPDGLAPADGTSTTDLSPTLSWNPSTDAVSGLRTSGTYRVVIDGPVTRSYYTTNTSYTPNLGVTGTYTWKVLARDNAGNNSDWSEIHTLHLVTDTTPPSLTVPPDATIDCDESTDASSTGEATATDDLDPSPTVTHVDGPLMSQPGIASTVWFFRTWTATDATGNSSSDDQRIDIRVPSVTLVDVTPDWVNSPSDTVEVTFTCEKCGTQGLISVEGNGIFEDGPSAAVVCDGITENTLTIGAGAGWPDGQYSVRISVLTAYGNMAAPFFHDAFRVDATPPTIPDGLSPPDNAWTSDTSPTFSWNAASDAGSGLRDTSTYRIQIDGPATRNYYTASTSYTPGLGTEGTYTWKVYSRDNAGNNSDWTATYTLGIDATAPVISGCPSDVTVIADPGATTATASWAEPTAVDALSGLGMAGTTHAPGDSFPAGTTTVTYEFTDNAGNTAVCSFDVVVLGVSRVVTPAGTAGFLDRGWPEGEEPPLLGELELAASYTVGEAITGCFTYTDAVGAPVGDPVILTYYLVTEIGEDFDVRIPLDAWFVYQDRETGISCFVVDTEELAPGYYDIRLGFSDDTVIWLRVELVASPPA